MKYLLSSGDAKMKVIVFAVLTKKLGINNNSDGHKPRCFFSGALKYLMRERIKTISQNISIRNVANCPAKLIMFFLCRLFMAFLGSPKRFEFVIFSL